jgi:hypothetical protein
VKGRQEGVFQKFIDPFFLTGVLQQVDPDGENVLACGCRTGSEGMDLQG